MIPERRVAPETFEPINVGLCRAMMLRGAEVGDCVRFVEVVDEVPTGRTLVARVTHVQRSPVSDACCASLALVERRAAA